MASAFVLIPSSLIGVILTEAVLRRRKESPPTTRLAHNQSLEVTTYIMTRTELNLLDTNFAEHV